MWKVKCLKIIWTTFWMLNFSIKSNKNWYIYWKPLLKIYIFIYVVITQYCSPNSNDKKIFKQKALGGFWKLIPHWKRKSVYFWILNMAFENCKILKYLHFSWKILFLEFRNDLKMNIKTAEVIFLVIW